MVTEKEKQSWEILISKVDNFKIRKGLISFINPYSMLILKQHPYICQHIDHWHVDGVSLINILSLSTKNKIKRYSFDDTSISVDVFNFARENNLKVAIVGTKENLIDTAVDVIKRKYGVNVVYYRNGYFKTQKERDECLDHIVNSNADVVICGMGTPFQEAFLIDLKNRNWEGYGFTCGGYLHQIARREKYYPDIFDKLNLRWLYRMIDEPKLVRRYTLDYSKFYFTFLLFKFKNHWK